MESLIIKNTLLSSPRNMVLFGVGIFALSWVGIDIFAWRSGLIPSGWITFFLAVCTLMFLSLSTFMQSGTFVGASAGLSTVPVYLVFGEIAAVIYIFTYCISFILIGGYVENTQNKLADSQNGELPRNNTLTKNHRIARLTLPKEMISVIRKAVGASMIQWSALLLFGMALIVYRQAEWMLFAGLAIVITSSVGFGRMWMLRSITSEKICINEN